MIIKKKEAYRVDDKIILKIGFYLFGFIPLYVSYEEYEDSKLREDLEPLY